MTAILSLIKTNWKTACKLVLGVLTALSILFGIVMYKQNKKLSEQLNLANNNIEAYQGSLSGSQQANNVLKLDMKELSYQNDSLIQKLDSVRKINKIQESKINTAATQKQTLNVSKSKGVGGDIVKILKDTINNTYKDSISLNSNTTVYYTISKDTVNIKLNISNTQYLYVYKTRKYKHNKTFLKRLFTFDFKKVDEYKYLISNSNDIIKESDVRIIENK